MHQVAIHYSKPEKIIRWIYVGGGIDIMGTLFNDSDCSPKKSKHSNCDSCICHILEKATHSWDCNIMSTNQTFYLQMKGTTDFIDLFPAPDTPTAFTLMSYCPKTCCAKFTYEDTTSGNTNTIIYDCRCLCGISPVPQS